MEIAFEERSKNCSARDLAFMIEAVNVQMRDHFCPAWKLDLWPCSAYANVSSLKTGSYWPIAVLDDINTPDALGYHDYTAGLVYGRVRWNGGFDGTAVTASHEALELRNDPRCDQWRRISGDRMVAFEMCDAVEALVYKIPVKIGSESRDVPVSDFVLPSYFDPAGKRPFSYLDALTKNAFELGLAAGGYLLVRDKWGNVSDYWGRKMMGMMRVPRPENWDKHRDPLSRLARRGFHLHSI